MEARTYFSSVRLRQLFQIGLGQILALLIAMTGLTSSLLAENGVKTPLTQTLVNYFLLAMFFGPFLLVRKSALDMPWYFYLALALIDVQANYCVVLAYEYTSITSVTLLDCWSIPCSIILSFFVLKNRYSFIHCLGVFICVIGLLLAFFSDVHASDWKSGTNFLLGDLLVILGSSLYAMSNVFEEFLAKAVSTIELLAMLGMFGFLVNATQLIILERHEFASLKLSSDIVFGFAGFALSLFLFYSLAPIMLQSSGAAMFNLSLLTSDIWAVFIRSFIFHQKIDAFFFLAFAAVTCGLLSYSLSGRQEAAEEEATIMGAEIEEDRQQLLQS